jgi:spore coat polysaccharide biosynthesis predicted glycosyltransferase SpsG
MTVSLSPIFNRLLEVDVVFHRTAIRGENWPAVGTKPLVRSGLEYAIIGEHCHRIPEDMYRRNLEREALSIAISMGGTDAANKTLQVVRTIKQIPERLVVWVLLGEGYAHSYQDLVDAMRGSQHEIVLAKTNDSMWRILSTCSLAILAGGTTTYEAAYAGLPSINTLETDQHLFLVQELVERGLCLCAGRTFPESLGALTSMVSHLNANRQELATMHVRSRGAIDGLGVQRVISEIRGYYRAFRSGHSGNRGSA